MLLRKLFLIVPLFLLLALPAFAADPTTTKSYCWPEKECKTAKGTWTSNTTENKIKLCLSGYGFCYPYEESIDLQIHVGSTKSVSSLKEYIPAVYSYAVSIVSIVAIVMIMIGGLQYLTAGGSPEKIGQAKERILGAVIGLLLVMGSYTLLQTVNPALLKWNIPKIKMVAPQSLTQWCPNTGVYEGQYECGTEYDASKKGKDGSGVAPPLTKGTCMGGYCAAENGATMSCTKLTYDGTDPPDCINKDSAKACEAIKKLGDACPNYASLTSPEMSGTCYQYGLMYFYPTGASQNNGYSLKTTSDSITISDSTGSVTMKLLKLQKQGSTYYVSVCKAGAVGCDGPDKDFIDGLCAQVSEIKSSGGPVLQAFKDISS